MLILNQVNLIFSLLQQTCVYLVIAYLFSRTRVFVPLTRITIRPSYRFICYVVFSLFCVLGTFLGLKVGDSIANTRAIGAVLGGILGGPVVGFGVGLTGGLHRYFLGGISAEACALSTIGEGVIGGLVHLYYVRRGKNDQLLNPWRVGLTTLGAEVVQMGIILIVVAPYSVAENLVRSVALPMFIANTIGAAMFVYILNERRALIETQSNIFSAKALKIATRTEGILHKGLGPQEAEQIAQIILEETGVGAVAITNTEKILAFVGIGNDHHKPNTPITSPETRRAIEQDSIVYAEGDESPYQCSVKPDSPLGISMVVPLHGENESVIGAIKLFELRSRLFSAINRSLGEGIGRLLSTQILVGRYEAQKELLIQSQIKLLHAQVNPHFLFNTLNTLSAIIRKDPEKARDLVQNLSTFFRKNLKRPSEIVSLEDELEHINAYLQIELARFPNTLTILFDVPDDLKHTSLPAFSLQPLVENAVKHGTSQLLGDGRIAIRAKKVDGHLSVTVEDNAGLFLACPFATGLGLNLVDQRIKNQFGKTYGLSVDCINDISTCVEIRVPLESAPT